MVNRRSCVFWTTPRDSVNQFIPFARVFDQQIQEHGRTREAVEETLRICRDQDVLRDYLVEEEVATIMFTLLDEQKARKFREEDLKQEGRDEGESRLGNLVTQLIKLGRIDDVSHAASDKAYRQKLYKELKIQ